MIIDTHAHLQKEYYEEDFDSVLKRAEEAGLGIIINPAFDLESSKSALELARTYNHIYACVGVHPSYTEEYDEGVRNELEKLLQDERVLAVGEIGLDYHYDDIDVPKQKSSFIDQIDLAKKYKMPIVIHTRSADKDTFDILEAERAFENGLLMHCYSQSLEMAREYIRRGAYLGIGGVVTFKNARKLIDVVREIPLHHLVIETDSPYLAPEPYRGKRNEPSYVAKVCEKIAELKGISYDEVAEITTANALKFFRIKY